MQSIWNISDMETLDSKISEEFVYVLEPTNLLTNNFFSDTDVVRDSSTDST